MFLSLGHTSEKINLNFAKLLSNHAMIKILVKNITWHSPHFNDHFLFLHQYELYIVLLNFNFIILQKKWTPHFAKLLSNLATIKTLVKSITWHSPHFSDHFLFLHQYELYIVLLNFDFIILMPSLGIPLTSVNFMLSIFRPYFWKSKLELCKAITWHSPHFRDHFLFPHQYELYIFLLNFNFIILMPSLGIPLTSVNLLSILRPYFWKNKLELCKAIVNPCHNINFCQKHYLKYC